MVLKATTKQIFDSVANCHPFSSRRAFYMKYSCCKKETRTHFRNSSNIKALFL